MFCTTLHVFQVLKTKAIKLVELFTINAESCLLIFCFFHIVKCAISMLITEY